MPLQIEIPIRDPVESAAASKLSDVLAAVEDTGSRLDWKVRFLEAVGDVSEVWEGGIVDLDDQATRAPDGVSLTWSRLVALAERIDQVIECRLDGIRGIQSLDQPEQVGDNVELIIQAIDGTLWSIYSRDPASLGAVASRFNVIRSEFVASVEDYLGGPGSWI